MKTMTRSMKTLILLNKREEMRSAASFLKRAKPFATSQSEAPPRRQFAARVCTMPVIGIKRQLIAVAEIQTKTIRNSCFLVRIPVSEGRPALSYSSPQFSMRSQK